MPPCSRICTIRLGSIFPVLIILFFLTDIRSGYSQSNFVPLERGDVTERKEHLTFSPGLKISGDYRFRTSKIHSQSLPKSRTETNSPEEFSFDQDLRIHLRSMVHRVISLNLEIATNQEPIYQSDIRASQTSRITGSESQAANLTARQSYLQLNR